MPIPHGLPVTLVLEDRRCLVVGGGEVAARKAAVLLDAGATVTMVAPRFCERAMALPLRRETRDYARGEVLGFHLVVTATGVDEVDGAVFADAEAAGVLVNAADDPAHCSFILPAVHRVGPVSLAVSTDGASPALAVWLRDRLAAEIDPGIGDLAGYLGAARAALQAAGETTEGRDWRGLIEALAVATDSEEVVRHWLKGELAITPSR